MGIFPSEPLRPEQRVREVDHQARGHEARKRIVEQHGTFSSEPVASERVADRKCEKCRCDGEQNDIQHMLLADLLCRAGQTLSAFRRQVHEALTWRYAAYVFER